MAYLFRHRWTRRWDSPIINLHVPFRPLDPMQVSAMRTLILGLVSKRTSSCVAYLLTPPKSSSPVDVGVFAALKAAYRDHAE